MISQMSLRTPFLDSRLVGARYQQLNEFRSNRRELPTRDQDALREGRINMESTNRRLMWHGMCLFLLGLLTGFAEPRFSNMRMGLAAHLEGLMNGIFLIALGAVWIHVSLPLRAKKVTYWIVLYGTYANWFVTTLAGVFGTAALSPLMEPDTADDPGKRTLLRQGFSPSASQPSRHRCSFFGAFAREWRRLADVEHRKHCFRLSIPIPSQRSRLPPPLRWTELPAEPDPKTSNNSLSAFSSRRRSCPLCAPVTSSCLSR